MDCIELIDDYEWILSVLNDTEMLSRICDDGQQFNFDIETVKKMADAGYFLGWVVDGSIKGFYWIHQFTHSVLQIHAHFPKNNRHHAKHSGRKMLEWLQYNTPSNFKRFISMIPSCYDDVIKFSLREGLEESGVISKSSYRDGECFDMVILGIDRSEL